MLPQANADPKDCEAVPDGLLFASPQAKAAALAETKDDRRLRPSHARRLHPQHFPHRA